MIGSASVKTYDVSNTSSQIDVTLDGSFQEQPRFLTLNRFEWYPTQAYFANIPQVFIHIQTLSGKYLQDGTQSDVVLVVNRNQDNAYVYVKTFPDPIILYGGLTGSLTFYFTDINNQLIDMGTNETLNGPVVNPNAVPYFLEFSINY